MAQSSNFDFDLIVIGSGAGGSAAATIAAREGKRVAIVEAETFGGDSPNWSDVPTKALIHAARLYDEAKHGEKFGLRGSMMGYNYPLVRNWKNLAVQRTGAGNNRRYYESHGISAFNGSAHFLSPNEITVNRRHLSSASFLIATGSSWTTPNIQGLDDAGFQTPRTLLDLIRPPKSLFIIGGGSHGVEFAQLMATFGTRVYIAEKAGRLLPKLDEEVGELIEKTLEEQKGVSVLTHSRVLSVVKEGITKTVLYTRGGVEKSIKVEEVLIAAGREPELDLGLENASVKYTPKGVDVNDHLQTTAKHIYAAGDVLGRQRYTHSALLESQVAVHNILHRGKIVPDYTAMPGIISTTPEIAHVGLSEDDCIRRDLSINKAIAPLNIIARSNTSDFRNGFVKLITDKKGVLLGGTIAAPSAGEMIHEIGLAVKYNLTAEQLAATPHAFLSWSEAIRVAANRLI
ncbi:MAG: Pyridine nucleotide-disulfide oxidoreductase [Candidatus Saccharibacteria bacterium]|nr:Pyridine nucleotide-disulfide oxidoreductase [Candidatus Saccharibacteria bacterium]